MENKKGLSETPKNYCQFSFFVKILYYNTKLYVVHRIGID